MHIVCGVRANDGVGERLALCLLCNVALGGVHSLRYQVGEYREQESSTETQPRKDQSAVLKYKWRFKAFARSRVLCRMCAALYRKSKLQRSN